MAYDNTNRYMQGDSSMNFDSSMVGSPLNPDDEHVAATSPAFIDTKYVNDLNVEKQTLDQSTHPNSIRLVSNEINRVTLCRDTLINLHNDRPTKVCIKVRVPVIEFPKFNFIGKIIGPKGNTLRRLQEDTECKIIVCGRGSMRDKNKEEELRVQGGKYAHLNEELHVCIESFGHPIDVHRKLSVALHALRPHLVPDYNDEITTNQVQELAVLNGDTQFPATLAGPGGRFGPPRPGPPDGGPQSRLIGDADARNQQDSFSSFQSPRGNGIRMRGNGMSARGGVSRPGRVAPAMRKTTPYTRAMSTAGGDSNRAWSSNYQPASKSAFDNYDNSGGTSGSFDTSFNDSSTPLGDSFGSYEFGNASSDSSSYGSFSKPSTGRGQPMRQQGSGFNRSSTVGTSSFERPRGNVY